MHRGAGTRRIVPEPILPVLGQRPNVDVLLRRWVLLEPVRLGDTAELWRPRRRRVGQHGSILPELEGAVVVELACHDVVAHDITHHVPNHIPDHITDHEPDYVAYDITHHEPNRIAYRQPNHVTDNAAAHLCTNSFSDTDPSAVLRGQCVERLRLSQQHRLWLVRHLPWRDQPILLRRGRACRPLLLLGLRQFSDKPTAAQHLHRPQLGAARVSGVSTVRRNIGRKGFSGWPSVLIVWRHNRMCGSQRCGQPDQLQSSNTVADASAYRVSHERRTNTQLCANATHQRSDDSVTHRKTDTNPYTHANADSDLDTNERRANSTTVIFIAYVCALHRPYARPHRHSYRFADGSHTAASNVVTDTDSYPAAN